MLREVQKATLVRLVLLSTLEMVLTGNRLPKCCNIPGPKRGRRVGENAGLMYQKGNPHVGGYPVDGDQKMSAV